MTLPSTPSPTVEAPPAPWSPPTPLPAAFRTPRLEIRPWRPEDASGMRAALDVDRASFLPYLPWTATDNQTVEQCLAAIERMRTRSERTDPPADDFTLGIFDARTGDPVGGTGLHRVNHAAHQGEIGYWVRPDRRREGLCTEAVAGLIAWAFTPQHQGGWGLRRIEILCAGSNAASQRVPQKLGLRQELHHRQHRWVPGIGWDDTLGWGVLAEEWCLSERRLAHRT